MAQTKAVLRSRLRARPFRRASILTLFVSWSLGLMLFTPVMRAQDVEARGSLRDQKMPDAALARASYGEAQRLARADLESGALGPDECARALRVLAMASAHLGDATAASRAFTQLLAIDPSFRLDRGESDEVRSPYLEARGFWSAHATPLATKVVRSGSGGVGLELVDPASLVARVRLRTRVQGSATFTDAVQGPAAQMSFPVSGLSDDKAVAYSVALIDEYGNRIAKLGSDSEPEQLAATAAPKLVAPTIIKPVSVPAAAPVAARSVPASPPPARDRRRVLFLSLGSAAMALGLGASAVGVRAHVEREDLAARWNKGACSGTGTTRAELCADERARIRTLEATTTALYSAGGAALVTGVVLLLLAPKRRARLEEQARRTSFGCSGSAGWLGVSCAHAF